MMGNLQFVNSFCENCIHKNIDFCYTIVMIDLSAAGLSSTESKCYQALLSKREWLPSELAKNVSETRTNMYKILDKLTSLGLAEKFDMNKKIHYRATSPTLLSKLVREKRKIQEQAEKELELQTESLLRDYIKTHEQPEVRYYHGKKELKEIYFDQVTSGDPIYIIRPDFNMDIYDFDYMTEIRHMARRAKLKRYAITPDRPKAPVNYKESDPFMLLKRTWINPNDYTAPVEWNAYGDKLAILSFGNEAVGTIIESPQIAEAFRQLYKLLEEGLRRRPDYNELPRTAQFIGATSENYKGK